MKKIRYCSECGSIGEVSEGKRDCCPTSKPSQVSHDVAIQAHSASHAAAALYRDKLRTKGTGGVQ